jgi:hypothetical protein
MKRTTLRTPAAALPLALAALLPLLVPRPALPADPPGLTVGGLLAAQASVGFEGRVEPLLTLRFIPEVAFSLALGRGVTLDGEFSARGSASADLLTDAPAAASADIEPYRGWIRLSTSRFEARLGLQKVAFGSATLFRPMMWFDALDPRDPLQLTDGVYALLLRYYTRGNANVWAWAMLGNDKTRGFDLAPPDRDTPEFGGRVQVPLFRGEIAATYHRRKAAIDGLVPVMDPGASPLPVPPVPEDRFGFDGKWDAGVGLWLEGTLVHQRTALLPFPYQLSLAAGLDYTFGIGRGLTVLAEQFRLESSARAFARGAALDLTGLLLRYPLGLADELSGIFYYDWKDRDVYRFLTWKRTSNALSFSFSLFWNPEELRALPGQAASAAFAGRGFQVLLGYYF